MRHQYLAQHGWKWPFDPADVAMLYHSGLSIRKVASALKSNRESVRRALGDLGLIRGRLDRHGDPKERIMSYVDKGGPGGCWLWLGVINNMGYGVVSLDGQRIAAHRAVYAVLVGVMPARHLDGCHKCDVPACVNPDHIFWGTRKDNMQDAAKKGRTRKGEAAANSVLTAEMIREAHRMVQAGARPIVAARHVGAPYKALHAALRGRTWKHLNLCGERNAS